MQYKPLTFDFPEIKGISKKQIELHTGLYDGYVTNVNTLMMQMNKLAQSGDEFTYSISELRRRLGFEWNGMRLHEIYFKTFEGGPKVLLADTKLYTSISKQYGSFSRWLEIFSKFSARGPGWALLNYDPTSKHFFHTWVAEHEIGQLAELPIIIALDHWEHAYMGDYSPSEKISYIDAFIKAINWETISENFEKAIK